MINLFVPVLFDSNELEITKEYSELIKKSNNIISNICNLENKFDLLVGNFFDFQRHLLEIALSQSLFKRENSILSIARDERDLTRTLYNFLSIAKVYLDLMPKILENIDADFAKKMHDEIKYKRETSIRENFNIRLMIALRNHMQHSDFSIGIQKSISFVSIKEADTINLYNVQVVLNLEKFMTNPSMKKQFPEGEHLKKDKIDLTEQILFFYKDLCLIHNRIRNYIKFKQKECIDLIESAFDFFAKNKNYIFDSGQQILAISESDFNDKAISNLKITILNKNDIKLIEELQLQNKCDENIVNQVICNATRNQILRIQNTCNEFKRQT